LRQTKPIRGDRQMRQTNPICDGSEGSPQRHRDHRGELGFPGRHDLDFILCGLCVSVVDIRAKRTQFGEMGKCAKQTQFGATGDCAKRTQFGPGGKYMKRTQFGSGRQMCDIASMPRFGKRTQFTKGKKVHHRGTEITEVIFGIPIDWLGFSSLCPRCLCGDKACKTNPIGPGQ
jgi:hypothetical protein